MKVVVLIGGEGTRLRPLTYSTPKQLLPVAGLAMLERVLGRLSGGPAVDEAVLSMGYRPDAFKRAYPDSCVAGLAVQYAVEPEPLDTAGAIRFAAAEAGVNETFAVLNGDVITDGDLAGLVDFHRERGAMATIGLVPVDDPSRFGVVDCDATGRVRRFVEKPPPGTAPANLINGGTYAMEPEVLDLIRPGVRVSVEREVFPELVARGSLFALPTPGYWVDAGTPEAYLRANLDCLDAFMQGCATAESRIFMLPPGARSVAEGVWATGDVRIEGDVAAPALLMDGSVVGKGAVVKESVVGRGCTLVAGAAVRRSVLMDGVMVAAGATIDEAIVSGSSEVRAGATVAGLAIVGPGEVVEEGAKVTGQGNAGEIGR